MQHEVPDGAAHDRDPIIGGWCFSDGRHRWPVSDCTAEALTAVLDMERVPGLISDADRISIGRVMQAIEFLLARQNDDGGFSTYERRRGPLWLDRLNPSEMFRDCMTEHSYVECTASAIEAMATVQRQYPDVQRGRIATSLKSAIAFIRQSQLPDGRFPAAWGICFTYSIFHVVKALRAAGLDQRDPSISNAVNWLKRVQRSDGGWGEHYSSCLTGQYVPHPQPQPVMTSWALLALSDGDPDGDAVRRGRSRLESMQSPDGSWPPGAVNGVFFGTAMLDYRLYHAYFPAWALARVPRQPRP
jgi:lanosterol synthase